MSKKKDRIILVVDVSGSMASMAAEASAGINDFIKEQKKVTKRPCDFSLVEFSTNVNTYPIKGMQDMHSEYVLIPTQMTAMRDGIGTALSTVWPSKRKEYKNSICVIVTDGLENASKEWNHKAVEELIAKRKSQGWEFIFMASGIDAYSTGESMGLGRVETVQTVATGQGHQKAYAAAGQSVGVMRSLDSKAGRDELDKQKLQEEELS